MIIARQLKVGYRIVLTLSIIMFFTVESKEAFTGDWDSETISSDRVRITGFSSSDSTFRFTKPDQVFNDITQREGYQPVCLNVQSRCPEWTASAGLIFLTRQTGGQFFQGGAIGEEMEGEGGIIRQGNFNMGGASLLGSKDVNFDYRAGYNIDVTRHYQNIDLHFNHFAVGGWNSTNSINGAAGSFSIAAPGFLVSNFTQARMTFTSSIASAELNAKRKTDSRFTPFVGLRWVQLNEGLLQQTNLVGPLAPAYKIDTRNDLFGLQIGADVLIKSTERFQLTGTGKFAIAGNAARNQIRSFPGAGAGNLAIIESGGTNTAFIFDFALKGKMHLSDHVALTGGYNIILLSQLALTPGQLKGNQMSTGVPIAAFSPLGSQTLDTNDFLIVHGGQINLEVTW